MADTIKRSWCIFLEKIHSNSPISKVPYSPISIVSFSLIRYGEQGHARHLLRGPRRPFAMCVSSRRACIFYHPFDPKQLSILTIYRPPSHWSRYPEHMSLSFNHRRLNDRGICLCDGLAQAGRLGVTQGGGRWLCGVAALSCQSAGVRGGGG